MFLRNKMANPYDSTSNNYGESSSPAEPDEISIFLQQILLRSSSSSSSAQCDHVPRGNRESEMGLVPGRVFVPEQASGLNSSSSHSIPANMSSSYVGAFDHDPDEYECESEEGVEALADEKQTPQRNAGKRSRAAEVHNLSEKRRRSRINEKMKALQNLIPNSNKTDKASMLDEAIEYLKQLQLQVQMLTLRNGLSHYPICLPGMLPPDHISQTRVDVCERSKSLNTEKEILMEQDISADTLLGLRDNCPKQVPAADFSTMLSSRTTFELGSSFHNHFEPFQFSKSSAGVCRNEALSCQQLNNEWCSTSLPGPSGTKPSSLKENNIETWLAGGDCLGGAGKLPHLLNNSLFLSQLNSDDGGRPTSEDIKTESDKL